MEISATDAAEWGCSLFCVALQVLLFRVRKRPWSQAFAAGVAVLPSAVAAAYAFTRFLSWDESYIFYDIVNYYGGRMRQWEYGSLRCSITILGPLLHAVQVFLPVTKDVVLILAKSLHWCIGAAVVTLIVDQAYRYLFPRTHFRLFHAVTFNSIMLLPVTGLALKTLNYDLLSMMPGVLGCIWCVAGAAPLNRRLLFAGMGVLTCASHEKLIASPFLWLSLVVIAAGSAVASGGSLRTMASAALRWSAAAVTASFSIVAASFAFVLMTHGPDAPMLNADQITTCWMMCLWPFLRLVGVAIIPVTTETSFVHLVFETAARLSGIVVLLFMAAMAVGGAARYIRGTGLSSRVRRDCVALLPYVRTAVTVAVAVVGVIAGYLLHTRIWPLLPVSGGYYLPTMTFNGIAHHFGCRTVFGHTLASMSWACAVFTNALPTAVFAGLIAGSVVRATLKRGDVTTETVRADILFCIFTSAPLLYGMIQIPLFPRYFNLFLAGSVVTGFGALCCRMPTVPIRIAGFAAMAIIVLTVAEVVPFEPLGSAFRPVWSNYSKEYNTDPEFGMVTPWYPGWGEELFCAYEKIEKEYHQGDGMLTLYYNFPAGLVKVKPGVRLSAMPVGHGTIPCSYGRNDYYIISRNGVSSYTYIPFPYGIPPLFTVADRGFVKAWVYRGSDLAAAKFFFWMIDMDAYKKCTGGLDVNTSGEDRVRR